ncbi:MAG TPA: YceI family protein [Pseudonocardiaceae bacterium]|nr:YceI family protein [Pseudonocardiaceae bacterium]
MGVVSKLGLRTHWKAWTVGAVVAIVVLVVGVPFVYIHVFNGDQPAALSLAGGSESTGTNTAATGPTNGTWKVADDGTTTTGYRVHEILAGQSTTAVGRTSAVTGSFAINGSDVTAASFTVDMTKVKSDKSQRDGQFQGRIMQTATYPTATFTLTSPISLGADPVPGKTYTANATGKLTLHGTTKTITFPVNAERVGNTVKVQGSIPITFTDYNISSPSFGSFVKVDPSGQLEFLLDLTHS